MTDSLLFSLGFSAFGDGTGLGSDGIGFNFSLPPVVSCSNSDDDNFKFTSGFKSSCLI